MKKLEKGRAGRYGWRSPEEYDPGPNIPNRAEVKEKTLAVMTEVDHFDQIADLLLEPLAGKKERSWFSQHAYFCLPITFGNQHGFVVKLLYDIIVRWNGGPDNPVLVVNHFGSEIDLKNQIISSHFGLGIITIQNRWSYRTPKGVNLLVVQPPNYPIDGLMHMTAVVEGDNLRRDFTFNLKVTRPNYDVYIPRGTPIGCVLPIPRGFNDNWKLEHYPKGEILEEERTTAKHFGKSRDNYEGGLPNHLYMRGMDIFKNRFPEHQKMLPKQTGGIKGKQSGFPPDLLRPVAESGREVVTALAAPDIELVDAVPKEFLKFYPAVDVEQFSDLYAYVRRRLEEGLNADEILALLARGGWRREAGEFLLAYCASRSQ